MISGITEVMKRITVDLTDELYEALRTTAFNERVTMSDLVRMLLRDNLDVREEGGKDHDEPT
jgi:hypothetical protein